VDESIALREKVLESSRRVLGDNAAETLRAELTVANARRRLGAEHLPVAQHTLERLCEVFRQRFGKNGELTLAATNDLANVVADRGDLPRAKELLQNTVSRLTYCRAGLRARSRRTVERALFPSL
jgi:hypothetical protein